MATVEDFLDCRLAFLLEVVNADDSALRRVKIAFRIQVDDCIGTTHVDRDTVAFRRYVDTELAHAGVRIVADFLAEADDDYLSSVGIECALDEVDTFVTVIETGDDRRKSL